MILNSLFIAEKSFGTKTRFDVTGLYGNHEFLELILINKRNPNQGGMSFYLVDRPKKFKGADLVDKAITKGDFNISSIYVPDPAIPLAYGDINGTNDALIFKFNKDTEYGITRIELFIARGQKHNKRNLYFLFIDGELDHDIENLHKGIKSRI